MSSGLPPESGSLPFCRWQIARLCTRSQDSRVCTPLPVRVLPGHTLPPGRAVPHTRSRTWRLTADPLCSHTGSRFISSTNTGQTWTPAITLATVDVTICYPSTRRILDGICATAAAVSRVMAGVHVCPVLVELIKPAPVWLHRGSAVSRQVRERV